MADKGTGFYSHMYSLETQKKDLTTAQYLHNGIKAHIKLHEITTFYTFLHDLINFLATCAKLLEVIP
jgi:hypothetical protein